MEQTIFLYDIVLDFSWNIFKGQIKKKKTDGKTSFTSEQPTNN